MASSPSSKLISRNRCLNVLALQDLIRIKFLQDVKMLCPRSSRQTAARRLTTLLLGLLLHQQGQRRTISHIQPTPDQRKF